MSSEELSTAKGAPASPAQIPIIIKKPFGGASSPGQMTVGLARLPGIFPSTRYGQQVVSTGIPSLDSYLGNGFPINSVVIIKDAFPSRFADMILKCFIAEGASYNHYLYIKSGGSVSSSSFANSLPSPVSKRETNITSSQRFQTDSQADEVDKLKIAWRYKDISPLPATLSTRGVISSKGQQRLTAKFEFTKKCSVADLNGHHLVTNEDGKSSQTFSELINTDSSNSRLLLKEIANVAQQFDITDGKKPKNFLRIALSHCESDLTPSFMTCLRALARNTNSCIILTISDLKLNGQESFQVEHFADYVIQVQGIVDETKKKQFGDNIDGLCEIKKLDSINSIKPMEKPKDLGFSFRKKRIIFQELHLQPEDDTTAQRETSNSKMVAAVPLKESSSSCGAKVKGTSIDF